MLATAAQLPTVFRDGTVSPLEDEPRPATAVLDQLDGTRMLHVLCALAVDLQDLVSHLQTHTRRAIFSPASRLVKFSQKGRQRKERGCA